MMRRGFCLAAAVAFLLLYVTGETKLTHPSRIDAKIAEHYRLAVAAYRDRDYSQVLGETSLILLNAPVRVYVNVEDVDPSRADEYADAVGDGIAMWAAAFEGTILFERVDERSEAQVVIRFLDTLNELDRHICGHVHWKRRMVWSAGRREQVATLSADIRIALRENPHRAALHSMDSIRHIATHELGHILGLEDSRSRNDVMGPDVHGRPAPGFSREELAAVRNLRAECLKLRGKALGKLRRWKEAEIAYRGALAIQPDDSETREELGIAERRSE